MDVNKYTYSSRVVLLTDFRPGITYRGIYFDILST